MDQEGLNSNSRLRASDADRDSAAAVLNEALADGRLTADEHAERLNTLYAARTHAEIEPVLDDLSVRPHRVPAPAGAAVERTGSGGKMVAILGGVSRKGRWHPDPVTHVTCVLGGAEIDLRDAILPAREITMNVNCVFGGAEIIIPPEMKVIDNGSAILGGRDASLDGVDETGPDSPLLRITGMCLFGGLSVSRKERKPPKNSS
jgi:hypothetical protein